MNTKDSKIDIAVQLLSNNELVVIPTETVYGLAANAFSELAIEKIYKVKNRPQNNPLIVHIASIDQLNIVAQNVPNIALKLANHFWPGPLTLILDKASTISTKITAGGDKVAVRIPNHKTTLELLQKLKFPLVAPSANRSNHISPTRPEHVLNSLGNKTPYILDGGSCTEGIESTIVGFYENIPHIYRLGAIEKEKIDALLGVSSEMIIETDKPKAPGMLKKHYSPKTAFFTTNNIQFEIARNSDKKIGVIYFCAKNLVPNSPFAFRVLSEKGSLKEAAANLYRYMHELDELELDLIIAEQLPNEGVGASINDRIKRASFI